MLIRWSFGVFLVLLSAFRLWYASTHGLIYDEAYYWLWARRIAPGYYDQGPGVALAIRFGLLFGASTGAVRLAAVLSAAITSITGYLTASRIFRSEQAGLSAGLFLSIVPLLFIGGILITHDSPQMATWAIALYFLARAMGIGDPGTSSFPKAGLNGGSREGLRNNFLLPGSTSQAVNQVNERLDPLTTGSGTYSPVHPEKKRCTGESLNGKPGYTNGLHPGIRQPAPTWWILAGLFAGASIDSKFTAVLFLPCFFLFLWMSPAGRRSLRSPWPYLLMICAVLITVPPDYWNASHNWASVRHILKLGGAHHKRLVDLENVGEYLGGQIVVALLFSFTMGWACVVAWRKGRQQQDLGLLLAACFSWPIWLLFFFLSFHSDVEANWPVPAYYSIVIVTPWLAIQQIQKTSRRRATLLASYHLVSFLLAFAGILLLLFPEAGWRLPGGPTLIRGFLPKTNEMYGWNQLSEAVMKAGWKPGGTWQVAGPRYQDAAELSFSLPGQPVTYCLPIHRRHNQFDFWKPLPAGSNAVVVIYRKDVKSQEPQVRQLFDRVERASIATLWRKPVYSEPFASYLVLRCWGYHGGSQGLLGNTW